MSRINTSPVIILLALCFCDPCLSFLQPLIHHKIHRDGTHIIRLSSVATSVLSSKKPQLEVKNDLPRNGSTSNQLDEQQLVNRVGHIYAQKIIDLSKYKAENGDCLVPKRYDENPTLGNWVNKQRQMYKKYVKGENSSMTEERIKALKEVGFNFDTSSIPFSTLSSERAWQKMYNKLVEFQKIHGHTNVPSSSTLGRWAVRQRYFYRSKSRHKSLSKERVNLLNELGFQWTTRFEELWQQRISELKEFKKRNGHCMVPRSYEPNPSLSSWVATQRKYYKLKKDGKPNHLTDEREKQLDAMDFVWNYWDYNFRINEF